jgi:hypothetical protein
VHTSSEHERLRQQARHDRAPQRRHALTASPRKRDESNCDAKEAAPPTPRQAGTHRAATAQPQHITHTHTHHLETVATISAMRGHGSLRTGLVEREPHPAPRWVKARVLLYERSARVPRPRGRVSRAAASSDGVLASEPTADGVRGGQGVDVRRVACPQSRRCSSLAWRAVASRYHAVQTTLCTLTLLPLRLAVILLLFVVLSAALLVQSACACRCCCLRKRPALHTLAVTADGVGVEPSPPRIPTAFFLVFIRCWCRALLFSVGFFNIRVVGRRDVGAVWLVAERRGLCVTRRWLCVRADGYAYAGSAPLPSTYPDLSPEHTLPPC